MWACTRYRARALNRLKLCPILCKPCSSFKAPLRYSNSLSLIQLATSFIMPSLPRSSFSPSSFSFQFSFSSSLSRLYLSPVLPFAVPTTFTSLNLLRKSPPSLASPRLAPPRPPLQTSSWNALENRSPMIYRVSMRRSLPRNYYARYDWKSLPVSRFSNPPF